MCVKNSCTADAKEPREATWLRTQWLWRSDEAGILPGRYESMLVILCCVSMLTCTVSTLDCILSTAVACATARLSMGSLAR